MKWSRRETRSPCSGTRMTRKKMSIWRGAGLLRRGARVRFTSNHHRWATRCCRARLRFEMPSLASHGTNTRALERGQGRRSCWTGTARVARMISMIWMISMITTSELARRPRGGADARRAPQVRRGHRIDRHRVIRTRITSQTLCRSQASSGRCTLRDVR